MQEIEAAYIRLSKDLDPKENDNLDFFIEEYNLVQEAYKQLTGTDDLISETEKESSKTNTVPENIKDISKKIPKNYNGSNALNPKEDSQSSNEKPTKTDKTNSNKQNNKSPKTNATKPNENNIPENLKKKRGLKIFLTIITSFILLYSISMFFYSKSLINESKIYYEKALVRYDLKDFNKANSDIEIIEDLYNELKDLPFFFFGYEFFENSFTLKGDILLAQLKYNNAILSYEKAISFNKDNMDLYIKIGDIFIKNDDKTKALDYYKKGIKLFKNYDFKQKFTEFYDDKKYLLSIAICDIEINKNPRSFDGYFSKARAHYMVDDGKSAIKENLIALTIKPKSKYALYNHGLYLYFENKYTDAIDYLSKAIKEDSDYMLAYFQRGKSYYMSKDYQNDFNHTLAIKDFNKAIQIDPKYAQAYSYRGSSNYFLKRYKKAVDDYRKAKSIDPDVYIYKYAFENSKKRYNEQVSRNLKIAKRNNSLIKRTKEYNKVEIGDYINGGIVFDKNYKTLEVKVMATSHSSRKSYYGDAKRKINDLYLNGYRDWVLPNQNEFTNIVKNNKIINSMGASSGKYFTKITSNRYWISGGDSRLKYMYGTSIARRVFYNSNTALSIPIRSFKF